MKKNRVSMIINIISIIIYSIITFFFASIIINALKDTSEAGEVILGIAFLFLLIIYGSIGNLVVVVMNIVALVFALIATPKKASRIILSLLFTILPVVTEVLLIFFVTSHLNNG